MRTLSREQASRLRQAHQGLATPFPDAHAAIRRLVAIQTQYPASVYPALQARACITEADVTEELLRTRRWLKLWSLRQTLHVHHREDHALIVAVVGAPLAARFYRKQSSGIARQTAERILTELDEPLLRTELHDRIPELKHLEWAGWGEDLKPLSMEGRVVLAEQAASRTRFVRTEAWCGCACQPEGTLANLFLRYLDGHAPATLEDFRYWMGVPSVPIRDLPHLLGDQLVAITVEGQVNYALPAQVDNDAPPVKGVRLLPKFDPLLLGWRNRSWLLDPTGIRAVVRPAGQIEATVMLNGRLVATWRRTAKGFAIYPFTPISTRDHRQIERAADRLWEARN